MTMLLALASLTTADATEIGSGRQFGLGLQLGEPWGITGKVYLGGRTNAIDFLVGAYYDDWDYYYGDFYAQVSYHWHVAELTSGGGVAIPFRVGVGGFLGTWNRGWWDDGPYDGDLVVGARVPVGLDFDLERAPVQFYIELALHVTVLPPLGLGGDAGLGARYYF